MTTPTEKPKKEEEKREDIRYKCVVTGPSGEQVELVLPGVTSILDQVFAKKDLPDWYFRTTVSGVSQLLQRYEGNIPYDVPSIHSMLSSHGLGPKATRDSAAKEGTSIHNALEALAKGKRPRKDYPALVHWWENAGLRAPNILGIEKLVIHFPNWYAGTVDLIYTDPHSGKRVLCDLKTGKLRYSHALQVWAYKEAWESMGGEPIDKVSLLQVPRDGSPAKESFLDGLEQIAEAWKGIIKTYRNIPLGRGGFKWLLP